MSNTITIARKCISRKKCWSNQKSRDNKVGSSNAQGYVTSASDDG